LNKDGEGQPDSIMVVKINRQEKKPLPSLELAKFKFLLLLILLVEVWMLKESTLL
jgi:hypothetical protein